MQLWTWQHPKWDITSEEWTDIYGEEMWGEKWQSLLSLYEQLRRQLRIRSFLWCYDHYVHWRPLEVRRVWWLDVPADSVYKVNAHAWEALLARAFDRTSEKDAWGVILAPEKPDDIQPLIRVPVESRWVRDNTRYNMGPVRQNPRYEDLPVSEEAARHLRPQWYSQKPHRAKQEIENRGSGMNGTSIRLNFG